ncbi:MAG: winged helix-turn-helix transcriptional regulator [Methanosarcinales archaeon]|nr:winged helix-turn-helix transcriptional regulator [Methanosarcinales archaeon]
MENPTMQKIVDIGEAIRHPLRIKIIYLLSQREWYIYELAKELSVSRQVLYLHLKRLEKSGFVEGDLRLEDDDMRAKNFYKLKNFKVELGLEDLEKIF